jgi:hypothetical protein
MKTSWIGGLLLAAATTGSAQSLTFSISGEPVTMALDTPVVIDGAPATLSDLRYRPNGMQARWSAAGTVLRGVTPTPVFSYTLIGPVTQVSPLAVLGQPITITSDTTLLGVGASHTLPLGTPAVVAGLIDANGSVLASMVERRGAAGPRLLLTGPVHAVNAGNQTIDVGDQPVSVAGAGFDDCAGATPVVGEYVELRANAIDPFPPGTLITTVTDARCIALVPAGTPAAIGFLEGLVTAVPSATQFLIGALAINFDNSTLFEFGDADDLEPGVGVIVHGSYVDAQTLAATEIAFVRPVVRFQAPIEPAAVVPGTSISVFGIPVLWSAQVRDEDGYLANGLNQALQVEVRGYLDSSGQAYATRVRDRGDPDINDVVLRGPVQAIAEPTVTIQGLAVDTTGAIFTDEYGAPLTSTQFFAGVQINHMVDASAASYNAAGQSLAAGAIIWIDAPVLRAPAVRPAGNPNDTITAGTGRDYAFVEPMFASSFE